MRRSAAADLATLKVIERYVAALIADWPTVLAHLDQWRRDAPGSPLGNAGGGTRPTGHSDLSDRLSYDHIGNLITGSDPVDTAASELGQALKQMLDGATAARRVIVRHHATPTPTSLCRHGGCPAGSLASTVIGGVPRCGACLKFWYSISNPDERYERPEVGAPHGVPKEQAA